LMMGGIGRTVMAAQVEIIHDTATMTRTGHHPTDIMMPDASPTTMGVLGGTTTTDKGVTTEYMGVAQNHHQFHHQYPHRGMPKDHKDMRMNGPRHMGNAGPGQVGMQEVESPDYRPSPEVLAELQEQFLFPLKKKSIRFPKAKYFCRLCDYHCDSLIVCRRHIADARHRKLKEAKDVETTLKNVPSPIEAQVAAVEKLILEIVEEVKVTPDMMRTRKEVVKELNKLLAAKVEGCRLEMVGSSVSGFCMKTSDINIDVVMDENLNPSIALLAVRELVRKNDLYT
ncbi:putative terminal uridylyltransferase 4-like, partial [Penaeus vannamei]